MRIWLSSLAAGLLLLAVLGLATTSEAAPLAFRNGSLSVVIGTLDPIGVTGTPVSGTVNGTIGVAGVVSVTLPADVFATTGFLVPVTDPGASPIAGVLVTVANAAGNFTAAGGPLGAFGGQMGLVGVNKVCLFAGCASQPPANVTVPVDVVGVGGEKSVSFLVNVTVKGAPWTAGTIMVPTAMGGNVTTAGALGAPGGDGFASVKLVTPIFVSTNIAPSAIVPAFAVLDFEVPEPSMLVLGLGAVAALVGMGATRRRA